MVSPKAGVGKQGLVEEIHIKTALFLKNFRRYVMPLPGTNHYRTSQYTSGMVMTYVDFRGSNAYFRVSFQLITINYIAAISQLRGI